MSASWPSTNAKVVPTLYAVALDPDRHAVVAALHVSPVVEPDVSRVALGRGQGQGQGLDQDVESIDNC